MPLPDTRRRIVARRSDRKLGRKRIADAAADARSVVTET